MQLLIKVFFVQLKPLDQMIEIIFKNNIDIGTGI